MYVCICNNVTDREIRAAVSKGANSLEALSQQLKVATGCGRCADSVHELLETIDAEARFDFSPLMAPA